MSPFTLIALTGPAGAGKDSAADFLVTHGHFNKLAFADSLRAEVANAFGLVERPAILTDRATKEAPHYALALRNCTSFCFIGALAMATHATVNSEWLDAPRSPRQVLQWWGTEYRRTEDANYWIKALAGRISARRDSGLSRFVVTDCRFANELSFIHAHGGKLWRLDRPGLRRVEGAHASATGLPFEAADTALVNESSLEDLRGQVLRNWWAMDSGIPAGQLRVEVTA
jgi:hypothetical protein